MSGKKSNEQAIQGRRLRPIYDALDSGQNKKAVQEADKVLKKHPGTLAARALKALALIRTERVPEAWILVSELEEKLKTGIYDENLIQAVCHCYKEAYMPERIVKLYEILAEKHSKDENILSQLFLAHVRVSNYKEQQRVAMQLYKEFNMTPYLMWSIMSIVMQGLQNEKLGTTMFYPLAEKMLQKVTQSYTFKAEEVDLYLIVLELRGNLKEAINYIEKDPSYSENVLPGTRNFYYLDRLYFHSKNYGTVIERAVKCLEEDCNDWTYWQYFLDAQFQMIDCMSDEEKAFENLKPKLNDILGTCLRLAEKSKSWQDVIMRRGPILACLEIISRLQKCAYISDEQIASLPGLESVVNCMKQLIDCSHTKPYCFADLKLYLHMLKLPDFDELIEYTGSLSSARNAADESEVNKEIITVDNNWNDILKEELVLAKISHQKVQMSEEERSERVKQLFSKLPVSHFQAGQVASVYGSLIAGYLLENGGSMENALTMIVILEHIRRNYADCDRSVLVLLSRLYAVFGDVGRVMDLCRQLDIKYIQRDSLGFMQFFLAERFGRFRTAVFFYTSISAQYDQGEREIAECCVNAYKNGSFSQITKLAEFQKKCFYSAYSTATDVMNRALSIFSVESADVAGQTILGDDTDIEWDNLCDNRDFGIVAGMTCDCCADQMDLIKKKSFEEMIHALKLQHSFCRVIGVLSTENVSFATFEKEFDRFEDYFTEATKFSDDTSRQKLPLNNFSHLKLSAVLQGEYFKIPIFVFGLAKFILEKGKSNDFSIDKLPAISELSTIVNNAVNSKIPEIITEISLLDMVEFMEKCASSLQYLVSALLTLKFVEQISFRHFSVENPEKNVKDLVEDGQEKTKNDEICEQLSMYAVPIVEALKKVRAALSSRLAALDAELTAIVEKPDGPKPPNAVRFPDLAFDLLLNEKINNNAPSDKNDMKDVLSQLKCSIEMSMKSSYTQGIQEMLGALFRADTKLLGSQL